MCSCVPVSILEMRDGPADVRLDSVGGDAEAARQAMTKHLIYSRNVLEDISKSHKDSTHEQ